MASANSNSNTNPINVDVHTQQATGNRQQVDGESKVKPHLLPILPEDTFL